DAKLGFAPARVAAGQTFDAAPGKDRNSARVNGSRIVRRLSPFALRRAEALFSSRRRIVIGDSRQPSSQMSDGRRGRNLHGNGASWPSQRAGELFEKIAPRRLHRVQ